jgi:hypothetical protein
MIDGAILAWLGLEDPYTAYLPPRIMKKLVRI